MTTSIPFQLHTPIKSVALGVMSSAPFICNKDATASNGNLVNAWTNAANIVEIPCGGHHYRFLDVFLVSWLDSSTISAAPTILCHGAQVPQEDPTLLVPETLVKTGAPAFTLDGSNKGILLPLSPVGNDNASTSDKVTFDYSTPSALTTSTNLAIYPRRTFLLDGATKVFVTINTAGSITTPAADNALFLVGRLTA